MTTLLIDSGNSRIKWAFAQNGAWAKQGVAEQGSEGFLGRVVDLPVPERILVSNVAGETAASRIRSACAVWDPPVQFIKAQATQCGVCNGYDQPEQLGSDRWAALIAARQAVQSRCLVVNCGTAITIDALSENGTFLGGLIVPGLGLMRRSLASSAAQLSDARGQFQAFPRNTFDAMHSGAIMAAVGAVREQYVRLDAAICLLSGGAAGELEPYLEFPVTRMDDIVLRGLLEIAQADTRGKVSR